MNYVILLFGVVILLMGTVLFVKPAPIIDQFRRNSESLSLHAFAVVIRLILGIALIIYAAESKFPVTLQVFGWLSITAAIILGLMGRARFKGLITWVISLAPSFMRIAGSFAILLGGFLVYAVA